VTDPVDPIRQLERRIAELERIIGQRRSLRLPRVAHRMIVVGLVLAMALPTGVVLAAHQFADVPDSHTFHADIGRISDAGITAGCTTSTFCPDAGMTRGQMAGFLSRGLGRVAAEEGVIPFADLVDGAPIAEVTIKTGGVSGGTGFLLVTATAAIQATDGVCPCDVGIVVRNGSADYSPSSLAVARTKIASGWWIGDATVAWAFEAPSGTDQTLQLRADGISWEGGTAGSFVRGSITALYIPFGPTGGSTLGADSGADAAPAVVPEP
jgi:hypothetical protein